MKTKIQIIFLVLLPTFLIGQDFQSDFQNCFQSQDPDCQKEVLKKWEKEKPNDAELFTSYFNYHFIKAKQEVLALSTEQPEGEGLELRDSSDQVAGFLGSQTHYDPVEIEKAFTKIDMGIEKFPDRLDMRFGKIYVLGELESWDNFTGEIIKTVKYSATNKNDWTWANNEKHEGGQDFFLGSLQDYQLRLYDTGADSLLLKMRQIAQTILEYYPEHVESLSNLSVTHLLREEYDEAIVPLLKAEKINAKDYIVLANIAHVYKMQGDKEQSIAYYEKIILVGNEEIVEFAKQQIAELKNND